MKETIRPSSVLAVACLYVAVGTGGFVVHLRDTLASPGEGVWVELVEVAAVIAGVFILRRCNWARWLALAWMAIHVAISFPVMAQVAVHSLFLAAIGWVLFRRPAGDYFLGKSRGT